MQKRSIHMGKLFAFAGMIVLGAVFLVTLLRAGYVSDPWGSGADYSSDCRFYLYDGSECGTNKFVGSSWYWGQGNTVQTWQAHKDEYYKHVGKQVFYKNVSSDPAVGEYYYTSDNKAVHCPAGAVVGGPHDAHLFASPSVDLKYDGRNHYWCSVNGAGADPVLGVEAGKKFPDFHNTASLFKVAGATDVYTFTANNWTTRANQLSQNGGYVKCKYDISGPYGTDSHYHCLSQDGSYEQDGLYGSTEADYVLIATTPPDTTPPMIYTVQASGITQTGATITWTTNENADSQVEYDLVPNYFTAPKLTTLDSTMTMTHSVNMTNLMPGTTYYYRARSKDAAGNLTYFSDSFTTLAVSTYSFELTKTSPAIGSVEAKAGATASIKIKLKNTSTASTEFPVYCDSGFGSFMGHMYYLNADGTTGAKFNSYAGSTSLPSGNVTLAAGAEKSFEFKFDIPASGSVGTWTAKCHTYPLDNTTRNSLTDKKQEITDAFTVTSTTVTPGSDTPATVVVNALTQYGANKYNLKVNDTDGLKEFSIKKAGGSSIYGGSPGTPGNLGACGGSSVFKSLDSGTVTLETADFPLSASVTDCRTGAAAYTFSVPAPGGTPTPVPGALAPEPSNNEPGVWAQVEISTGQITGTAICTKSVCGLNGEYHGYVPPPTYATGATWWPTSKRYIWQVQGQAGYSTGTFNFDTYIFTVSGGTIYNGQFTSTSTPTSCGNGEKCSKGSWCNNGQKCFYPDSQITCAAWPSGAGASSVSCPAGTSLCDPTDTSCVAPGQTVSYSSGKWCSQSQAYYSTDGKNITCVAWGGGTPAGYTVCRPDDKSCIPENSYGPSSGSCNSAMKCYQKATDVNANNDVYCAKMPTSTATTGAYPEPASCPAGYSACSPTDANCKEKGDKWTDSNSSYYCMSAQKCSSASGGGSCVGWNEQCPAGTKYCDTQSESCIEPGEYKPIKISSATGGSYWCGGGGGMVFYSSTQAYCEKKARTPDTGMMWTGEEIKAVLAKLGSGWRLCFPGSETCIEPGKTGPSSSWCAWIPPGSATLYPADSTRICPALDGSVPPTPIQPPTPEKNWVRHTWTFTDGSSESFILNRTDKEYLTFIASIDMQCAKISKDKMSWKSEAGDDTGANWKNFGIPDCSGTAVPPVVCGQAITRAYNPKTGECRDFSTTCIGEGWVRKDCKIEDIPIPKPEEPECSPGQAPSSFNMCIMPTYRWIYSDKKFEKCLRSVDPRIMSSAPASMIPMRPGTSCQSMNYDLEVGWKTKRYLVHPPEKDGEWYMPPWDATYDRLRYSPDKDSFEECSAKDSEFINVNKLVPDVSWIGPCQPVPPEDKEWMLEMYRAQYKMFLMYKDRQKWPSPIPGPTPGPEPFPVPEPTPVPAPDPLQCKPYLNSVRMGLIGDKQFWKDVNRKLNEVKATYSEAEKVGKLLVQAKELIVTIDKAAKKGGCSKESLAKIKENLDNLHLVIFSELGEHLTDMEDLGQLARCKTRLSQLEKETAMFAKKAEDEDDKQELNDLLAEIDEKLKEFENPSEEDLEFDAVFECETFSEDVDMDLMQFRRYLNEDTSRISDAVVKKLGAHIDILSQDLSDKENQIDTLIVQVAELKKTAEALTQAVKDVSDKLIVSYTALMQMQDKFKEDRRQILDEKEKLVKLVEEAMGVMKETACVRSAADRDRMASELGQVATINWTPDRGQQLEKRIQLVIDSCRAKDFTRENMTQFFTNFDEAERSNLSESYRRGYTPFQDVPTHEWYYGGMVNAYENGYMTKGMPAEKALAQDALLMVLRAAGFNDITGDCELTAPQVKTVAPYAVCAVNFANSKGLPLQSDMLQPVERIRIAEWITLLKPDLPKRADEAVDFDSFADIQSLGNNTRFVAYMYANGIMVGRVSTDGKTRYFDPRASLARAELAVILDQVGKVTEPEAR